jgi:predicted esterase
VLGFSQGVATASRWLAHSNRVVADRLVCWGGAIPEDVSLVKGRFLAGTVVRLVAGARDEFVDLPRLEREVARLESADVPVESLSFEGGHRLDNATLRRLADGKAAEMSR